MSLENGNSPENNEVSKSLEMSSETREMIERYMSFGSFGTRVHKQNRLNQALQNEETVRAAEALVELTHEADISAIKAAADELKNDMIESASKLGIRVSQFGKDSSWVMKDMGAQYRTHLYPDEFTKIDEDLRIDILHPQDNGRTTYDISDRGLAAEARSAYYNKRDKTWRQKVDDDAARFAQAHALLQAKGDKNGNLSYRELTELGHILKHIADQPQTDVSITEPARQESNEPISQQESPRIEPEPSVVRQTVSQENRPSPEASQHESVIDKTAQSGAPKQAQEKLSESALIAKAMQSPLAGFSFTQNVTSAIGKGAGKSEKIDHHDTVASEMRDSLRSLGNSPHEKHGSSEKGDHNHEKKDVKHETHDKKEKHGDEDDNHDDHGHAEPFRPTPGGILNAAGHSIWYIPSYIGLYTVPEVAKTFWESAKGMFGVFWKLAKKGFSFKALNENASGGGGGHKKEEHKADHGGGHDDHGGHGHDAHGGDHGKKKDDHGHGGGHGGGGHH